MNIDNFSRLVELKNKVLENTTIPVFDLFTPTYNDGGTIATLYFSKLKTDGSDFKFGIIIGLEEDREVRWRTERCFDILKTLPLYSEINMQFPDFLNQYAVTGWLIDEDIVNRLHNVNYTPPYHFSFPSIRQFKEVSGELLRRFDHQPIELIGYVKIHGVNASLIFTKEGIIKQSKEKTITVFDQYGFAHHIERFEESLMEWGENIRKAYGLEYPFTIAGEWAGKGIIKKSSVSEVMPFFTCFLIGQIKEEINPDNGNNIVEWKPLGDMLTDGLSRIFDIRDFGHWVIKFNPTCLHETQKELSALTIQVENNCPVANFFGIKSDIGEGIVWHPINQSRESIGTYFKVKGKKHSNTKVKTLASPNPEKLEGVNKFLDYVLTDNRYEQAVRETGEISKKNMGSFLSWIAKDVMKEEFDTLKASGLEWKTIAKPLTNNAMNWYKSKQLEGGAKE